MTDDLKSSLFKVTRTWYVEAYEAREAVQLARQGEHVAVTAESTNTHPFLRARERDDAAGQGNE